MRTTERHFALPVALMVAGFSWACAGERSGEPTPVDTVASRAGGVRGQAPPANGGVPSVVLFYPRSAGGEDTPEPARPADDPAPPGPGKPPVVIDQFGLAFSPRALVLGSGTAVRFTNSEGALTHNVHLRSIEGDSTVFNGDTSPGEIAEVRLPEGGYDVLCDMHPGMTAFLFVTAAPFAAIAEQDGSFKLEDIPDGDYHARLWTAASGRGPVHAVRVEPGTTRIDLASRD